MITHPDPEQLSAYIDGELTGHDRDDLEQHLSGCSDCTATVRALRATLADMRAMPSPVPSEQESWALRAAITKARKKPAQRYRRLGVAAASVAVIAAVVTGVGLTRQTPKATLSRPGGAGAPALAPVPVAPVVQIDSTNYTSHTAATLMRSVMEDAQSPPMYAPAQGSTAHGGSTSSTVERKAASSKDLSAYSGKIARCQSIVLSRGSNGERALAYIVGRYEGTPVFFLVYSIVASGKTETEMWVVQQSDCYIRLFLAPQ